MIYLSVGTTINMDQILLYQKITDIKPDYGKLEIPSQRPSIKKVQFTLKELELHYYEEFKAYLTVSKLKNAPCLLPSHRCWWG